MPWADAEVRLHCYDCGRSELEDFGEGLLRCTYCSELMYPSEAAGGLRARWERSFRTLHHLSFLRLPTSFKK